MPLRSPESLWKWSRKLHQRGWKLTARMVKAVNFALHKCLLPAEAEVGKGVSLEHYALGVVMHPQVRIGHRCRVYHHVTLAGETWIGSPHFITLEDDVTIGAHSIVVARPNTSLTIGRRSVLGAGSVLTKSIPPHEVWAGNPARKIGDVPQNS
ncbi:MAG: serine acetyltransferase [Prosthecobacter sp.]|uniref:DapH/DapD/GlmU-related protein n=1 Tax=Prosthecobacter sp. TaxID=1965333 RepID=UPI0019E0BCEF|nr:DapH/DapD/GlmU-related protein [Prosthecobacter sp.]MBE2286289.1 serine acetyltransferase [Prosthecobacter sp.]